VPTEILEEQTQSTVILKKKKKNQKYFKNLNTSKVACKKFGIYEVKEAHSGFPRTKEKFK